MFFRISLLCLGSRKLDKNISRPDCFSRFLQWLESPMTYALPIKFASSITRLVLSSRGVAVNPKIADRNTRGRLFVFLIVIPRNCQQISAALDLPFSFKEKQVYLKVCRYLLLDQHDDFSPERSQNYQHRGVRMTLQMPV